MVEDQGSKEEKLEFTPEGEALGYISLDQARVLAMRTARETPGAYGLFYADIPMAFDVVEAGQTEDHYVITLSFRPQGEFAGRAGREQFFFEKEGNVAHRQVLSLPSLRRRIPRIAAAVGLALVAAIAVGVSIGVARGGGDDAEIGIGPGLTVEASVSTEGESPEGANEPQNETPGSSAIDPLDPTAGLDYLPVNQEGFLEIPADLSIAQTFTASANGVITGAEIIGLSRHQCAADEALGFRLLATNNGLPGDLVFYSGTLSVASIPKEPANIEIKFGPNGWPVGAFESLALQLLNATESSSCYYIWDADWGGTYTGGQAFIQSAGSNEWKPDSRDMGFRVFFRPESDTATPVPTISSLSTQDLLSQPWRQSRREDEPDEPWNERIGLLTVSTDHSTLYALNTEGCISNCRLYRSFDQGKTWWPIPLPFGWSATLALRAVDAREIYAWSGTTMWRSVDGGNQWTQLHTPTGISNPGVSPYIRAFAVSPEMLYMATADQNYESGGLFQSPDKGENWRLINGWLPGITLLSVAGDPATMYLAWRTSNSYGLQWSRDGGRSWDRPTAAATTGDITNWRINDFSIDFSQADTLYVAVAGEGLLSISAQNPREYAVLWPSDTAETEVQSVATHPNYPEVLAIRTTEGLFVTSDGGAWWVPLHQAGYQISNVLYQGLPEGVNGPVVTTGSPWTICIGSVNGVWYHRGA